MSEPVSMNVHNEAMKRLDAENERQNHRIDALEKTVKEISKLTTSVERLAISMENMANEQREQGEQLKELQNRDGEMWRTVVRYALTAGAGAVIWQLATMSGIF